MLQDIEPKVFSNVYKNVLPDENSKCVAFRGREALVSFDGTNISFPLYSQVKENVSKAVFAFTIDSDDYFLVDFNGEVPDGFGYENIQIFRRALPKEESFAVLTAFHLFTWYSNNKFCGKCGAEMEKDTSLRMLKCPKCSAQVFPRISPAVIVGVADGDRLLMTKYNGREYKGFALIAGFNEIGESIEKTIEREVYEEAGIKVKNIKYFASQPWGMDGDLLLGFFAELDGSDRITMDGDELSLAKWYHRDEIVPADDHATLTNAMIKAFVEKKVDFE